MGNRPGSRYIPPGPSKRAVIAVVTGIAQKEAKRRTVKIGVSIKWVVIGIIGGCVVHVVRIRISGKSGISHHLLWLWLRVWIIRGICEAKRLGGIIRFNRDRSHNSERQQCLGFNNGRVTPGKQNAN